MRFEHAVFRIARNRFFTMDSLELPGSGCVAFVGANGSGRTSLARSLCGELELCEGRAELCPAGDIVRISFEEQVRLMEEDFRLRNTDMASPEEMRGLTPRLLLGEVAAQCPDLCRRLGVEPLLDRPFHVLSSGEGRRILIARALLTGKRVLVMDAPFDGLDECSRQELMALFGEISAGGRLVLLVVNRYAEIPAFASHAGILSECRVIKFGRCEDLAGDLDFLQLENTETVTGQDIPPAPADAPALAFDGPLAVLRDVVVTYDGRNVIDHLTMTVNQGENWQIRGPNGAGKSTLLALITGDQPQGYANDITLFGIRRGSGESVWDIKKRIGFVSPAFHLSYRVNCSVRNVVISGFYDSVGLYERPGDEKSLLADRWLEVAGLRPAADLPFRSLSFGQQRIVLILRALVKHPPVLILDEPMQGLDPVSRLLVRNFAECLMRSGTTQLMFVSHHREDAPRGITNILDFVPCEGTYEYRFTTVDPAAKEAGETR